ncbi:SAF domain-containing protein [Chloroflexus sp.]|uniref:SAF domain-containing protein n=1 Tax=Chloroflexus sp. TaxID=1904827 RepID=UPI00298F3BA5|nr:SAF domain-containing protein [Chloroflexus sp.]MCX7861204.1 SAF domain-containing protein [Chloroflexus sp.]MDW8404909.1 SAF domain-containing protein [Chloroflexus sp.]
MSAIGTLNQALTRRRANPLPAILIGLGLIITAIFTGWAFFEAGQSEPVVILARDVPYGKQLSADDLAVVLLPRHRPAQLTGIGSPSLVVGQYATRNLAANDLLQPSMIAERPPAQPIYPNGEALTPGMVPVPFSTETIGPLTHHDRVNIGFNDPNGSPDVCDQTRRVAEGRVPSVQPPASPLPPRPYACRLLSGARVLYVDAEAQVAYLELTPYQSQAIWALQAAGLPLWGERYSSDAPMLPALERLDIGQFTVEELTAPVAPVEDDQ